ncbi:MAG: site-specific DNA-methyltransferase [Rhodopila sp.]
MDAEKEAIARSMPVLMREHGVDDYYVDFWRLWMNALRNTQPHLLAYLIYMVQRLLYMKSILRPTGSIYLHCDPTASHYIKVMMDGIFGHENFINEIIWKRTSAHSGSKKYAPIHDVIFYYRLSKSTKWNPPRVDYDEEYLDKYYKFDDGDGRLYWRADLCAAGTRKGESGKPWRGIDPGAKGMHWKFTVGRLDELDAEGRIYWPPKGTMPQYKRYREELKGKSVTDIWDDINRINPVGSERLGYPTQKPIALLERIISASTDEGDVVFDPFCGCGTTVYAAERLGRRWIGCDIAILAVKLIRERLAEQYRLVEGSHFEVDGIPVSVEQAQELFRRDPFQFQHWAIERVGGFPMQKKVADRGIDGRIYFETRDGLRAMMMSVKGGKTRPTDVRDLRGVLEREDDAEMGGFISLEEPTKAMRDEAATAGIYEYGGTAYPRMQLLTIREILEEKREFLTPSKVRSRIAIGQAALPL